ncbi:MAG: S16 family serine protease, partial [Succinivibrio sp.]|nr:S16 family serine protease [Succinivibrio sp.]
APIDKGTIAFGEVGLTGEIRPVPFGQERILEAVKQGFVRIIVPFDNAPRTKLQNVQVIPVKRVTDLLSLV